MIDDEFDPLVEDEGLEDGLPKKKLPSEDDFSDDDFLLIDGDSLDDLGFGFGESEEESF